MALVSPSILSADFNNLSSEMKMLVDNNCEYVHFDVMDGHFVPNISFGSVVLKCINNYNIKYDVHLMISDPQKYAIDFIKAGANIITFHYEAVEDCLSLINYLHSCGVQAGISIKPNTDVHVLDSILDKVDLILIMSVEPGFGAQKFMNNALGKIEYLHKMKEENGYKYLIEVDGGINNETGKLCTSVGCDILVAGSYVFSSTDPNKNIEALKKL